MKRKTKSEETARAIDDEIKAVIQSGYQRVKSFCRRTDLLWIGEPPNSKRKRPCLKKK